MFPFSWEKDTKGKWYLTALEMPPQAEWKTRLDVAPESCSPASYNHELWPQSQLCILNILSKLMWLGTLFVCPGCHLHSVLWG